MTPAVYCIARRDTQEVTRIGAYTNATTARVALQAMGEYRSRECVPVAMYSADQVAKLLAAAMTARAALSELLVTRDPKVYADALRALDEAIGDA